MADTLIGTAYAVLDSEGTLTFFRSENEYTAGEGQTVTDIDSNEYTGEIFVGVENTDITVSNIPWHSKRSSIINVNIANEQIIRPAQTAYWFYNCSHLAEIDLADLDTSNVTNMSYMFSSFSSLMSLDLTNFNTSNVINMEQMFGACESLTSLNLSNFDTSNVTNMRSMFSACTSLSTLDLSSFNTSNVTNMSNMFFDCTSLSTLDLSSFNTSKVTDMSGMFYNCSSFTFLNVTNFDISNVINMSHMFFHCSSLTTIYANDWYDSSKTVNSTNIFSQCISLIGGNKTAYDSSQIDWTMALIDEEGQSGYFVDPNGANEAYAVLNSEGTLTLFRSRRGYQAGENQDVYDLYGNKYTGEIFVRVEDGGVPWSTKRSSIINVNIASGQVIKPAGTAYWFFDCNALTRINLTGLDTSNVTNMKYMFGGCISLTSLDVTNFDTSNVTDMSNMFEACVLLTTLNLTNFNTSNVTDMSDMFAGCLALTTIYANNWYDSSKTIDSSNMFWNCQYIIGRTRQTYDSNRVDWTMAQSDNGYFQQPLQHVMLKGYHYIEPTTPIRTDSCKLCIVGEESSVTDTVWHAPSSSNLEALQAWDPITDYFEYVNNDAGSPYFKYNFSNIEEDFRSQVILISSFFISMPLDLRKSWEYILSSGHKVIISTENSEIIVTVSDPNIQIAIEYYIRDNTLNCLHLKGVHSFLFPAPTNPYVLERINKCYIDDNDGTLTPISNIYLKYTLGSNLNITTV